MHKKSLEVKKYYDSYPYPSRKLLKKAKIKDYAEWILKKAKINPKQIKNKKVLEAGCGTGELSISFSLLGAKTTGIDISRKSIKIAKKNAEKFNANTIFLEKNIYNLKPEKFDFIFSLGVLHHTVNPEKAFEMLARQTKKQGFLCIGLYHKKGRLKQRIKRFGVRLLKPFGFNIQKKAIQLIYGKRQIQKRNKNYVYDKFLVPIESYHTEKQVKNWFKKEGFLVMAVSKPAKGFFVVSGKKA